MHRQAFDVQITQYDDGGWLEDQVFGLSVPRRWNDFIPHSDATMYLGPTPCDG